MMKHQFKYFSRVMLLIGLVCNSNLALSNTLEIINRKSNSNYQFQEHDKLLIQEDSLVNKKNTVLSHINLVLDYGKLMAIAADFESKSEFGLELGFASKLFVNTEIGFGSITPNDVYINTNYNSKGNYYRIGLGYEGSISNKTNMGFSVKYASGKFSDSGLVKNKSTSGLFDDSIDSFERKNLKADWYEIVLHSESLIMPNLYAGFKFSVRRMLKYDVQSPLDVNNIPGYGRTFDKSTPALNFYIKYRFTL